MSRANPRLSNAERLAFGNNPMYGTKYHNGPSAFSGTQVLFGNNPKYGSQYHSGPSTGLDLSVASFTDLATRPVPAWYLAVAAGVGALAAYWIAK